MSTSNVSPASFMGGSWAPIKDRMLIGAGNSYGVTSTGGSTTHTLTVAEMPSHTHGFAIYATGAGGGNFSTDKNGGAHANDAWMGKPTTEATGGSTAFNIMNPYYAVYMWRRTS